MEIMRDYIKAWVSDDESGRRYRQDYYERRRPGGWKELFDNPTVEELIADIEKHEPESIIEIGCGFGHHLGPITDHFGERVVGCDVCSFMRDKCREDLTTFYWDICKLDSPTIAELVATWGHWDVGFCRSVFLYFNESQMRIAMNNLARVIKKKMIIYEWPYVCNRMKKIDPLELFEYLPVIEKDE